MIIEYYHPGTTKNGPKIQARWEECYRSDTKLQFTLAHMNTYNYNLLIRLFDLRVVFNHCLSLINYWCCIKRFQPTSISENIIPVLSFPIPIIGDKDCRTDYEVSFILERLSKYFQCFSNDTSQKFFATVQNSIPTMNYIEMNKLLFEHKKEIDLPRENTPELLAELKTIIDSELPRIIAAELLRFIQVEKGFNDTALIPTPFFCIKLDKDTYDSIQQSLTGRSINKNRTIPLSNEETAKLFGLLFDQLNYHTNKIDLQIKIVEQFLDNVISYEDVNKKKPKRPNYIIKLYNVFPEIILCFSDLNFFPKYFTIDKKGKIHLELLTDIQVAHILRALHKIGNRDIPWKLLKNAIISNVNWDNVNRYYYKSYKPKIDNDLRKDLLTITNLGKSKYKKQRPEIFLPRLFENQYLLLRRPLFHDHVFESTLPLLDTFNASILFPPFYFVNQLFILPTFFVPNE